MASTKRPTDKKTRKTDRADRPRLRSSHGGPEGRAKPRAAGGGGGANGGNARARRVVSEAASRPDRDGERRDVAPRPAKAPKAPQRIEVTSTASEAARELAIGVAVVALEKKAVGLEILDVAGRVDYADFLVLMSGRSDRHVAALAQSIEEELKKKGHRPLAVEGLPHAVWVLIDYADVVVHVFQEEHRHLYNLEGLWMDARRIPVPAQ